METSTVLVPLNTGACIQRCVTKQHRLPMKQDALSVHLHFQVHADLLNKQGVLQAIAPLSVRVHALLYTGRPGKLFPRVEWQSRAANASFCCDNALWLSSHGSRQLVLQGSSVLLVD